MIIKNVSLETVCGITSKLPENIHPEVAFAGKSNVGKSSLINGLMNRKSLARTSSQPGKTQTINYYNINDEIYFVDLPGYGYAQANEHVKAQWGKMIEDYLHKSKQLKLVFLLIDIRHAPSENDRIMYDWIRRQWLRSHYHCHQAGQDQPQSDTEAGEADPHHPAGRSGYTDRTLFRTDETGKGRNLRDPGRCLGCRGSCTGIDSRNGE